MKKYNPQEFLTRLRTGNFEHQITLIGMVKMHSEDEAKILFAVGTICERWIPLPIERVESIEVIDTIPCQDHTHPFVRIELKTPTTEEAKFLTELIISSSARTSQFLRQRRPIIVTTPPAPRSCSDCELLRLACEAAGGSVYECSFQYYSCLFTCSEIGPGVGPTGLGPHI